MRRGWLIPGHRAHHIFVLYWREHWLSITARTPREAGDGLLYHLIFKYLAGTLALFQTAAQGDK
jgi:hypothetical protein